MIKWKKYRLGDVVTSNLKNIAKDYPYKIIKYLDTGSIKCGKVETYQEFNLEDAPSRAKRLVKEHDIIYSNVRPIQRHYGYIKKPPENLVVSTGFSVISTNVKLADSLYIYYLLSTKEIVELLDSIAEGSTSAYPSLKPSDIENLEIILPPLSEQKEIAEILSSLDDKIDLLHRQNKTLEAIAETVFRQWFVEPCKNGLPKGWEEGTILSYADHLKKTIYPYNFSQTEFFHYSIPSYDANKQPILEMGSEIQSNKYCLEKYCILFSKLNPQKDKRIWLLPENVSENSICSTEFQVIKPKSISYLYFLYGWLSSGQNYAKISSGTGGTSSSHQRIDPKIIFSFKCPLVPDNIINEFNEKVISLYKKQVNNQIQIRSIERTRNSIFSKLISGEVWVEV
jgi:type I restriction enzyme S subunit